MALDMLTGVITAVSNIVFVPPIAYVFWGLVGFGLALWFVLKYYNAPQDQFEIERFSEVVNKDLDKALGILGMRSRNTKLIKGMMKIGDITKHLHEKGKITTTFKVKADKTIKDKPNLIVEKAEGEYKTVSKKTPFDLHIFEVNVGDSFLNIFGKGNEKIIVDAEFLTFDPVKNVFQINENINMWKFAEVWVTSETGKEFITDIAWKRSLEMQTEETMNLAKKTTYLEMRMAKKSELMEKATQLEQEKYKQYTKKAILDEED